MQKSWIENNEIIIFYFAYDRIMSSISTEMIDQNEKFKIIIFVLKKSTLKITSKSDILNDSDFQILHITDIDIDRTTGSETSPRYSLGNGPLGLANIWSRLLKHNWWDFLYKRVRIHSNVFFDFTFNENSSMYDYINRASFEFQPMHVYDQQLWFLFHRCESFFLFLNSWK